MDAVQEAISEEERRAVEVHKWYLSQRAGCDVGWGAALEDWKRNYQADWRKNQRIRQLTDNTAQAKEIQDYVWYRSQEAGADMSRDAQEEWVRLYAAQWREQAAQKQRKPVEDWPDLKAPSDPCSCGSPAAVAWREIAVRNEKGLHVRPSMKLKKLLDAHQECEVYVQNYATNGGAIRVREMTQILSLGAICGDILLFGVSGPNACQVMDEIERLFESRFEDCC